MLLATLAILYTFLSVATPAKKDIQGALLLGGLHGTTFGNIIHEAVVMDVLTKINK